MSTALQIPSGDHAEYSGLKLPVRKEVDAWIDWLQRLIAAPRGMRGSVAAGAAAAFGCDVGTVWRKRSEVLNNGWRALINRSKQPQVSVKFSGCTDVPAFEQFASKLAENNQRGSREAFRDLKRMWKHREPVPGYEKFPGWPEIPKGWSHRNLYRVVPKPAAMIAFRIGMSAAAAELPQVLTTRANLYVGSHYMFDDLWHDNFVYVGDKGRAGRVLELDALDVFSANKFAWGCKPRLENAVGVNEGLKKQNMRMLLAAVYFTFGYSPRGTIQFSEHGTALVDDEAAEILHRWSDNKIVTRRSGIIGEEQAVLGLWKGDAKGNPRMKSPLEALRALMHTMLANLPAQAGLSRDRRPETTSAILDYVEELSALAEKLPPHRRDLLKFPILEYHSQFLPLLQDVYAEMNGRADHALEGWAKAGGMTVEYRLTPSSHDWIGGADFLALPDHARHEICERSKVAPDVFSRPRRLSPAEMYAPGARQLVHIPPIAVCELLDWLIQPQHVDGAYFNFQDKEIDLDPLIYKARLHTLDGRIVELPNRETYNVLVNPFDPRLLFVLDSKKAFLGLCERVQRADRGDDGQLVRAYGEKAARTAERLAPMRDRHAGEVSALNELRRHNNRILGGEKPGPASSESELAQVTPSSPSERDNRPSIDELTDTY